MRYSKAQLNAISRAYRMRQHERQLILLFRYNLYDDFHKSKYKYMTNYLKYARRKGLIPRYEDIY